MEDLEILSHLDSPHILLTHPIQVPLNDYDSIDNNSSIPHNYTDHHVPRLVCILVVQLHLGDKKSMKTTIGST